MKLILFITFLVVSTTTWAISGMVVEKTGTLTFTTPEGKELPATFGDEFLDGYQISSEGGSALLLLANGFLVPLSEGASFKNLPVFKPTPFYFHGLSNALKESLTTVKMGKVGARTHLEPLPLEGGVEGLFPVYGTLSQTPSISFRWRGARIAGPKPALVFFEEGTSTQTPFYLNGRNKEISISAEELGLKRGKSYCWYLGREKNHRFVGQSRVFRFNILSDKEEKDLHQDFSDLGRLSPQTKEGKEFLKAQIYYKYHMYHAMIDTLKPLYENYQSRGIKRLLFLGFVRLGRHHEAKKYQFKN